MMKNYDTDDTFLGRWIAGELSEEERIAFEKTDAFKHYSIINKEATLLEGPTIDTEAALHKVKTQIQHKATKPKKVINLWYRVAAAAILIISAGFFLNSSKTYTTAIGETETITLTDGSVVNLNTNSSLTHKRFFWNSNKEVTLSGEGYFTVTKGDGFKVKTSKGTVSVLGTEFNIKDRTHFEVKCYEGKVRLNTKNKAYTLTKGMQVSIKNKTQQETVFTEQKPSWKSGVSTFKDTPLHSVLEELSLYFPVSFNAKNINTTRLFTGNFNHNNLETALKTTLLPMGISYTKSKKENSYILTE
jgi:ferric-dicitrate binding protein FerR (iron transport regulator)